MKQRMKIWTVLAMVCVLSLAAGSVVTAWGQAQGQAPAPGTPAAVSGEMRDVSGNVSSNVTVTFTNSTTKQSFDTVTDGRGLFRRAGLPPGNYSVTFTFNREVVYETVLVLNPGQQATLNVNFKELKAKDAADAEEAAKKAAENREKFASMKAHFDAGNTALEAARATRAQMDKLPRAEQASLQPQLSSGAGTAITEYNAALEVLSPTDANRGLVLARLGEAYELTQKYTEAAGAYQQAVAAKPDPAFYNNLGNSLARTGKVDDALAAYQKAIELDPTNTAMYWRNFAVGLYNSNRIKESVEPLKKATEADPKSAQAWYLLGAALVYTMEYKTEGDKTIPIMQPGTIEAYQKAIELEPNGPYGAQAKDGLEALQAMGVGINTKVNQRPANNNNNRQQQPARR
jgi:tetratricopeptide (TPR) repeat protein